MPDQFDELVGKLIEIEGVYSNDPSDSGGKTKYGITEAEARSNGYEGDMQDLPIYFAKVIYRRKYWMDPNFDEISRTNRIIAAELFDTAVNCGVKTAVIFLQRCLNVFNIEQKLYPDLKVDGEIGPKTLEAFQRYSATRNNAILLKALNCLQGAYYIELAERRAKDERFIYGWIRKRI